MTSPGSMGQQAAQQAAASASRGAQQNAATSYQHTVRNASNAVHRQHYRGRRRFGLFGRLVSLVFTLVIIAVAAGIVLLILSQAQPDWFDSAVTWFEQAF